jgi:hypothetical protein
MSERFAVDTPQAQQITERLVSIGASIAASPEPGPVPTPLGSGMLEEALAEFRNAVTATERALAGSIDKAATNFASLVRGAVSLDEQEAERV